MVSLKNLCVAHGTLFDSHFNHIVCFYTSFPYFLTKINAHSLFRFLDHSECDKDSLPSLSGII